MESFNLGHDIEIRMYVNPENPFEDFKFTFECVGKPAGERTQQVTHMKMSAIGDTRANPFVQMLFALMMAINEKAESVEESICKN